MPGSNPRWNTPWATSAAMQQSTAVPAQQVLELGQPRRAEVLGLVDDDHVEAVADLRPVAVEVPDGDRVPPRAIGTERHLELRHPVERARHREERADDQVGARCHPIDQHVAERVVVAGEQHPLAPGERTPGPGHAPRRVLPLPAPPVTSTRRFTSSGSNARTWCSQSWSIRCAGAPCPSPVVEVERRSRAAAHARPPRRPPRRCPARPSACTSAGRRHRPGRRRTCSS